MQKEDINVYAYKGNPDHILDSVRRGVSRFGWSSYDNAALVENKEKQWYKNNSFLLRIKNGDWIVHINIPKWGWCIAAQVTKSYYFDEGVTVDYENGVDYRHCIGIDANSIVEFDRNDPNVYPLISQRLKSQGRWLQIYESELFIQSVERIKSGHQVPTDQQSIGLYYLGIDISNLVRETEFMTTVADLIHKTHPGKKLEDFVCDIFQNIEGVHSRPNGRGWRSNHGADVIVEYSVGLPIEGLQEIKRLVVQVKSYSWKINDQRAVAQVKKAVETYDADSGLIISTAPATDAFIANVEALSEEMKKPIVVLAGEDFARFVLQHCGGILGLENIK